MSSRVLGALFGLNVMLGSVHSPFHGKRGVEVLGSRDGAYVNQPYEGRDP